MNARTMLGSLFALVLVGCTDGATSRPGDAPPAPAVAAPAGLQAAHQAYLDGDWIALGERVRDVLLDPSAGQLVRDNAYALLEKSYEVQGGKLPTAFKLPPDFEFIKYGTTRVSTPYGSSSSIYLYGRLRNAKRIKGITLRRLPGEILLDTATSRGKFDIRNDEPGFEDFSFDSGKIDALPADGVFTVRITLDDGSTSEGWFIGHALESTGSPELRSPAPSESLTDPNPLVAWSSFRSPQYAPFEKRNLNIWVSREGEEKVGWNFWTGEPGETGAVRIGAHEGAAKTKLLPGDYWLAVTAGEERQFGPFKIVRGSQSAAPFHVVR
jgi:hypothetical protein